MTKAQKAMLENYNRSTFSTLDEVYQRYSKNKVRAFEDCEHRRKVYNGYDARIPSHSYAFFSYAFKFKRNDGKIWLHYETVSKIHEFCIDEG